MRAEERDVRGRLPPDQRHPEPRGRARRRSVSVCHGAPPEHGALRPSARRAAAAAQSSFWLFDFPADPCIACVANLTGTLFMDQSGQLNAFSDAFDNLRASAPGPADSLTRITDIMDLMRRERDTRNPS
ncbi:Scr1 family TA system antitoxin-like transcriptional regulator [Streptomyces cyaneofuscatus]|uniref:Scr1 family TA system antitoxin-like transcriptional regulator n=1 Tax=Streptomyces cyaneofuscatus TaxID=66883 RepID=UPI002FF3B95F